MFSTVEGKVQAIMRLMSEFLDTRFTQAMRINPRLENARKDLEWQQKMQLEIILRSNKSLGIEKFIVSDILMGDDERMKRRVMALNDQISVFHQIVEVEEEKGKGTEAVGVTNLRGLYKFIDPSLENFMVLVQSWVLWDLMDAAEFSRIAEDINDMMSLLSSATLPPEIEKNYRTVKNIENPSIKVDPEDVLIYRWHCIKLLLEKKKFELSEEPAYKMIVRRDPLKGTSLDSFIAKYYQSMAKIHSLRKSAALPEADRATYAAALGVKPEEMTAELALQFENMSLESAKEGIIQISKGESPLGAPYNLKKMLLQKSIAGVEQLLKHPRMNAIAQKEIEQKQQEENK